MFNKKLLMSNNNSIPTSMKIYFSGLYEESSEDGRILYIINHYDMDEGYVEDHWCYPWTVYGTSPKFDVELDTNFTGTLCVEGDGYSIIDPIILNNENKCSFKLPGLGAGNYTITIYLRDSTNTSTILTKSCSFGIIKADSAITVDVGDIGYGDEGETEQPDSSVSLHVGNINETNGSSRYWLTVKTIIDCDDDSYIWTSNGGTLTYTVSSLSKSISEGNNYTPETYTTSIASKVNYLKYMTYAPNDAYTISVSYSGNNYYNSAQTSIPANSPGYISSVITSNIAYGENEGVDVWASVPNNYYVIFTLNDEITYTYYFVDGHCECYIHSETIGYNKLLVELYTNNGIKIDQVIQYFEVERADPVITIDP